MGKLNTYLCLSRSTLQTPFKCLDLILVTIMQNTSGKKELLTVRPLLVDARTSNSEANRRDSVAWLTSLTWATRVSRHAAIKWGLPVSPPHSFLILSRGDGLCLEEHGCQSRFSSCLPIDMKALSSKRAMRSRTFAPEAAGTRSPFRESSPWKKVSPAMNGHPAINRALPQNRASPRYSLLILFRSGRLYLEEHNVLVQGFAAWRPAPEKSIRQRLMRSSTQYGGGSNPILEVSDFYF